MTRSAPGPGLAVLTQIYSLRRDPLAYMLDAHRRWGDVVRLGAGRAAVHLVNHFDLAEELLTIRNMKYDRATRSARAIRFVTGESILTTSGAAWRRRRLLMQPSFNSGAVQSLAGVITSAARSMLSSWSAGGTIDAAAEMQHLAFTIAGEAFFGADVGEKSAAIERLVPVILEETYRRATDIVPTQWFRRAAARRFKAAVREVDAIVRDILSEGAKGLSAAMLAQDEAGHARLTTGEVRNETIALLLAGHETTANALTWTLHLLSIHPQVAAAARIEVRDVVGDRTPEAADLKRMTLLPSIVLEALRLYPPIWVVERRAIEEEEIGGYAIPAGSIVYVSPYVLHRDPRFWDRPDEFDPSRFGAEPHAHRASFLPFGAGPHHCIGSHFAMLEAQLILALILQRFDLTAAGAAPVEPHAWITLRPRGPVRLRVTRVATSS